jgi:hypothetical protein
MLVNKASSESRFSTIHYHNVVLMDENDMEDSDLEEDNNLI